MNTLSQEVTYRVDADDMLIEANNQWDAFATANDSGHLVRDRVMNRRLWDFIRDPETRQVHRMLANKVRDTRASLRLPFRCDAPAVRRFMQMDINPAPNGGIEYRCRVVKTEGRVPIAVPVASLESGERLLRICSWCKRVNTGPGQWLEIEEAIKRLRLFEQEKVPSMTHTMCDDCMSRLEDEAR